jgi:hypothetical protein
VTDAHHGLVDVGEVCFHAQPHVAVPVESRPVDYPRRSDAGRRSAKRVDLPASPPDVCLSIGAEVMPGSDRDAADLRIVGRDEARLEAVDEHLTAWRYPARDIPGAGDLPVRFEDIGVDRESAGVISEDVTPSIRLKEATSNPRSFPGCR